MCCKNKKYKYTVEYLADQDLNTLPKALNRFASEGYRVVQVIVEKNFCNDCYYYVVLEKEIKESSCSCKYNRVISF